MTENLITSREALRQSIDLDGRYSQCPYCKTSTESRWDLPFFDYQGKEGGYKLRCIHCSYTEVAHNPEAEHMARIEANGKTRYENHINHGFSPEPQPLDDRHYCGCRGWD